MTYQKHTPGTQLSTNRFLVKETIFVGRIEDARLQFLSKQRKTRCLNWLNLNYPIPKNDLKIDREKELRIIFKQLPTPSLTAEANGLLSRIMSY